MFVPHIQSFTRALPAKPIRTRTGFRVQGLPSGTLIETAMGWRRVEALVPGDLVAAVEGGLRPLQALERVEVCLAGRIMVPEGALHNNRALHLPAGQLVMVDGPVLERLFGLPCALVRAEDLIGLYGIRASAGRRCEIWQLRFDREAVIWANGGMCLHCPARMPHATPVYARLERARVRRLRRALADAGSGLRARVA